MKRLSSIFLLLLLFSSFALSGVIVPDEDGPSANGSFQISMENGISRDIKFNARSAQDGSTTGEIVFRDATPAPDPKSANINKGTEPANSLRAANSNKSGSETVTALPFYAKAVCDCLSVKGIEAVMSGTITESSLENYVGRRVLLVVQDGDSITPPLRDKLTFGFYRTITKNWVATDGERPDAGGAPTWVATDAERPDDLGALSQKSEQITCESFPISAHSFISSKQGRGTIEVRR